MMAWIESHQDLAQHRKTLRLSRLLGVSIPAVIGHLHLLWWWALDNAENGNLAGFEPDEIAHVAQWEGDCAAFWTALQGSGFVDQDGAIHDWYEYAGKLVDRRKADAERKRSARRPPETAPIINEGDGMAGGHPVDVSRNSNSNSNQNRTSPDQPDSLLETVVGASTSAPEDLEIVERLRGLRGWPANKDAGFDLRKVREWRELYPDVDLRVVISQMDSWLAEKSRERASPKRIGNWLERARAGPPHTGNGARDSPSARKGTIAQDDPEAGGWAAVAAGRRGGS